MSSHLPPLRRFRLHIDHIDNHESVGVWGLSWREAGRRHYRVLKQIAVHVPVQTRHRPAAQPRAWLEGVGRIYVWEGQGAITA